jgi:glycosyltransferase involved in cell wall biosynthesis
MQDVSARRVLFAYWGRRGPIGRLALQLMAAAADERRIKAWLCGSLDNELVQEFQRLGHRFVPVRTFERSAGALRLDRMLAARAAQARFVREQGIDTVVTLMPHVWTGAAASPLRGRARHVVVLHDAAPHPGDPSGWVARLADLSADRADRVVLLSTSVARALQGRFADPVVLFHPVLDLPFVRDSASTTPAATLRVLFFGRILPYKGLSLLLDACRILQERGEAVSITVAGEGAIHSYTDQLRAVGAHVRNRWIDEREMRDLVDACDVVVAPYLEASQSGVVAVALGAGAPVLVTPVGGLVEQVKDGETGLIAEAATVEALSAALARLIRDPDLRRRLREGVAGTRREASVEAFLQALGRALWNWT